MRLVALDTETLDKAVVPICTLTLVKSELSNFLKLVPVRVTEIVSLLFTPDAGEMSVTVGAGVVSMIIGPKWLVSVQLTPVSTARTCKYQVPLVNVRGRVRPV